MYNLIFSLCCSAILLFFNQFLDNKVIITLKQEKTNINQVYSFKQNLNFIDTNFIEQIIKYKSIDGKQKWLDFIQSKSSARITIKTKRLIHVDSKRNYFKINNQKVYLDFDSIPVFQGDFSKEFFENFVDSLSDLQSYTPNQIICLIIDKKGNVLDFGNCIWRHETYYAKYLRETLYSIKNNNKFSPAKIANHEVSSIIAFRVNFGTREIVDSKYFQNNVFNLPDH